MTLPSPPSGHRTIEPDHQPAAPSGSSRPTNDSGRQRRIEALPMATAPGRCCGLGKLSWTVAAAIAFLAVAATAYFAGRASRVTQDETWAKQLPPIDASGAVSSEKFSIATGVVTDEAEGLFVLDHNSGLLQCSVMYPRAGRFLARFSVNVGEALAIGGKNSRYIMTTGRVDFPRASNRPVGTSVVYVLNTATGVYACYGIPFDRTAMTTGQPQQGTLPLLATGGASPIIDRDSLR